MDLEYISNIIQVFKIIVVVVALLSFLAGALLSSIVFFII